MSSIQQWLSLDKLSTMIRVIRHNGGPLKCISKLFRQDALKEGVLVGIDELGNRYFENPRYFMPRNRWVEYADYFGLQYDGSQVPAEWYGWLHHKTDMLPCEEDIRARRSWSEPHTENLSGTSGCYVPYSTTRPTIIPWDGKPRTYCTPPPVPVCDKPKAVAQCKPKCKPKCKPVDCQSQKPC